MQITDYTLIVCANGSSYDGGVFCRPLNWKKTFEAVDIGVHDQDHFKDVLVLCFIVYGSWLWCLPSHKQVNKSLSTTQHDHGPEDIQL